MSGPGEKAVMADPSILTQIYEIQTPGAAEKLLAMGVDHIGSVVLDEQHWKIPELKETVRLVSNGGARSSLLPLFSSADAVSRALDYYQPDIVHLCQTIPWSRDSRRHMAGLQGVQIKIRERFPGIRTMRSLPVGPPGTGGKERLLEMGALFEPLTDFFLTDTVLPVSGGTGPDDQPVPGFVGITGTTCDWEAVAALVTSTPVPVILAGGLSPDNVSEAISRTRPAGVDSCTRTNRDDGCGGTVRFEKDYEKVRRFVDEARRAAANGLSR
jgi:phosphoribosylanthranilate isomerase